MTSEAKTGSLSDCPSIEDLLRDAEHWRKEHDEVCAHLAEYEGKLREARRDAETFQASQRWGAADELGWQDTASAPLVPALAAARAEGRREAIEECARLVERLLRNSCLADPGAVVAAIRALAGGENA